MKQATRLGLRRFGIVSVLVLASLASQAPAREAAFMDPGTLGNLSTDGAIKVEPKPEIDTGESVLNVARRTTVFFVNQTNQPVHIEKITTDSDGNVKAEIANDDCSKQGTIPPLSRCSLEISVTPSSPGPWSVDALMTHDGAGRIVRVKLSGKTSGSTEANERKDTGLALSTKEVAPINFGDVDVGSGKAVRSALMVNDSPEVITLYSIDVIEADNGLERLDQGCTVDMELKPGESCPVTLVWTPTDHGQISTDLIIRHSGRLGFAVIPIRGNAKGDSAASKDAKDSSGSSSSASASSSKPGSGDPSKAFVPLPPSATDLQKAASGSISPVNASAMGGDAAAAAAGSPAPGAASTSSSTGKLRLIGLVGTRAVLLRPDGTTVVANLQEDFDIDDKTAKVVFIGIKSADVEVDGKKKTLPLQAAPELISKASAAARDNEKSSSDPNASSATASSGSLMPPTALGAVSGIPGSVGGLR